jgi:hypothetical protein
MFPKMSENEHHASVLARTEIKCTACVVQKDMTLGYGNANIILDNLSQEGYSVVKIPNHSEDIQEIFKVWNAANISVQKRLDKTTERVIRSVLKEYPVDEIKASIENYANVLRDPTYLFSYKWRLAKFLKRGLDDFLPEAEPLERMPRAGNYANSGGITPPVPPVPPAFKEEFLKRKKLKRERKGNQS